MNITGVVVIGIDATVLNKAGQYADSPEATLVAQLEKEAAALHAGSKTYVIKPIAYDEKGKELFSFDLVGIDGGGKQYNTDDIIKRKQNEIYTVFLADILKMGQDQVGSYALSDNKSSHLELATKHHLNIIKDVIDNQLIPNTLALNGWFLEEDEMPKISYGDIERKDLETISKFIQRTVAVGAVSVDQELDNTLRSWADLPETKYETKNIIPEDFKASSGSRSSDGMKPGTSGNGTSTSAAGRDNSVANTESQAVTKALEGFVEVTTPRGKILVMKEDYEEYWKENS